MARANNTPQRALKAIQPEAITEMVTSLIELRNLGKPGTDAEVKERCDQYFRFCANSSLRPGIEGLALSLGVDRTTVWKWSQGIGCSKERAEIVSAARQAVITYIEAAQLSGKLNPVSSIFLLKNWANYTDRVEVAPAPQQTDYMMSQEEIAKRIPLFNEDPVFNEDPDEDETEI